MKAQFVYERLEFDRGNNPLDSLNIGNKGARIYQKLSDIAQVLNIEEVGIEDLNKKKAIASWRIPGIKGNIDRTGYGRIILYLNDIGGEKEYQVYAKGKRGSDIQSWENWNSIDKWKENLHQLNESVNFERGKDPKEIMDIGMEKILKSKKYPDNDAYVKYPQVRIKIRDLMGIPLDEIYYLDEDHPALAKHPDKILNLLNQYIAGSKSVHLDFYDLKFWPTSKGRLLSVQGTWGTRYYGDKQMASYYFGQRESLEFERGKDPKKSMGIGKEYNDRKFIEETDWDLRNFKNNWRGEYIYLDKNYKGHPILVIPADGYTTVRGNDIPGGYRYLAMTTGGVGVAGSSTPKGALRNLKRTLIRQGRITESLEFERGKDPKASLGIGAMSRIKYGSILQCKKEIMPRLSYHPDSSDSRFRIRSGHYCLVRSSNFNGKVLKLDVGTYNELPRSIPNYFGGEHLTLTPEEFFEHFEVLKF